MSDTVSAGDWLKGIGLSLLASVVGGASKLAIRKSWLMQAALEEEQQPSSHGSSGSLHQQDPSDSSTEFLLLRDKTPRKPAPSRSRTAFTADATETTNDTSMFPQVTADPAASDKHEQHHINESSDEDPLAAPSRRGSLRHRYFNLLSSPPPEQDDDDDENYAVANDDGSSATRQRFSERHQRLLPLVLRGAGMLGMTILNPLCSVIAMNYASPSILAPFSGLTLVWVVLFSGTVVGEAPNHTQVLAASLIVLGEVVVAVFGDHTNDSGVTIEDVRHSYKQFPFILYCTGLTVWMLLCFRWMTLKGNDTSKTLQRFGWGVSGGSITGLQNFLKDSLTILKAARAEQQAPPLLYFIFTALAGITAFIGLLLLTAGMKRYDATYSSAMFVGSFVVSASLMSAAHYHTFRHLQTGLDNLLYPSGLVILMGGVYILVHDSSQVDPPPAGGDSAETYGWVPPDEVTMEEGPNEASQRRRGSSPSNIPLVDSSAAGTLI